jgi:hypothetical protein
MTRYAVVDLASAPSVASLVTTLRPPQGETLFQRDMAPEVLEAGPWLVDLDRTQALSDALGRLDAESPWGYIVHADVDLLSLRHGLRKFNLTKMAGFDRPVLFRYWDPRVLDDFMSVSTSAQRRSFMEWIDRIEGPGGSFEFRADRDG